MNEEKKKELTVEIKKNIKNKLAKFVAKVGNKYYLDKFTNGIGKLVEEDDRFVCYVDNKKIKKNKYRHTELVLGSFNSYSEDMSRVYKFYKVDKPIHYVIDGAKFEGVLFLYSFGDSYVTFKNCEFNKNIIIKFANSVTFMDNKYYDQCSIYYGSTKTFLEGDVRELKFINDQFYNSDKEHHPCFFGMDIDTEKLEVINSNIMIDNSVVVNGVEWVSNRAGVSVKTKKIVLKDSVINASEVYLDYDEIDSVNSVIIGGNGVIIDDKSNDTDISIVNAPYFIYNGEQIIEEVKISEDLSDKRKELTRFLSNFRNYCVDINNSKSVRKILKNR